MQDENRPRCDVVGIGIGPANLSLAALLAPHARLTSRFVDRRAAFSWHGGLMLPAAALQVSYLKDLVTPVDPTSRYSFLAFLHAHKRLYNFLNAEFPRVQRREFNEYLVWASAQLRNLEFGCAVNGVRFDDGDFVVTTEQAELRARHLVLGVGTLPTVPACTVEHLGPTVFHGSEFLFSGVDTRGKRVVVVGGGQSGAEIVSELLAPGERTPASLAWISRRSNFLPLDETHFTNELFTPGHSDWFFGLPAERRAELLREHKLASDGISPALLGALYRRMYELRFLEGDPVACRLCPGRELERMRREDGRWVLHLAVREPCALETLEADLVILCTGYTRELPPCFAPLADRLHRVGGELDFRADFSVGWDGPDANRIYVQNGAQSARGIADPNLSLLAWRSARIANSLLGEDVYDLSEAMRFVDWGTDIPAAVRRAEELV